MNFPIPSSIKHTFMDAVVISAARYSMVHNMQDAAALPTDKSTNHTENHEKSLRNKVQYRDRKLNTQDKKVDELIMEVMTHEEK